MNIQENITLAPFTTFSIGGIARYFCVAQNEKDLEQAMRFAKQNKLSILVLGGGSNTLVSDAGFPGLVINFKNLGFELIKEDESNVWVKVASGESWDDVVARAVEKGWWGIENLSHVPGLMGGVPVQNVGCYGQEASQVVESVEVLDTRGIFVPYKDSPCIVFTNPECKFGYRSSIFNREEKGKYVITHTIIKLQKNGTPNLSYGDVKKYFTDKNIVAPTLLQIRQAITEIRDKKFPFPDSPEKGSAGSFFNAPAISEEEYEALIKKVSDTFSKDAGTKLTLIKERLTVPQGIKVPFGYLIEACGLKGHTLGGAKVCETHAGVIMNASGKASAKDVLELFCYVRQTVYKNTGIILQNEPELVGFTKEELDYYFRLE